MNANFDQLHHTTNDNWVSCSWHKPNDSHAMHVKKLS